MKKYALVRGNHVRYVELRETPKFLMSADKSCKIKKFDNRQYVGSGTWWGTDYNAYEVDHPHVLNLIREEKERHFIFHVVGEIEKLHRKRSLSFEEAKKINELLDFGVEL